MIFINCSTILDFHLFADDSNIFFAHKCLATLEKTNGEQLHLANKWLCDNKLSLNIEKSNFAIFYPPQKKLNYLVKIVINGKTKLDISELQLTVI